MNNIDKLNNIFDKYKLKKEERKRDYNNIKNIFLHPEYQRRLTDEFLHHGTTTLGEHILEDTVCVYVLSKKRKYKNIDLECALKIAMMHDLYTTPWQNSCTKKKSFFYKHGFAHPIEAVINSVNWFSDEFKDENKSKIIIDGIAHHMYPFPVLAYSDYEINRIELFNYDLTKSMPEITKRILIESSNRNRIGKVSFTKPKYKEGRILLRADRATSINQLRNLSDIFALVTGKNNSLNRKKD